MSTLPRWIKGLGATGDAVFIVDPGRRILLWNASAEQIFGYAASEVIGRRCCDVLAGRTCSGKAWCHSYCQVQRAVGRGATQKSFDLVVRAKDGREVCANVSILAVPHRHRPLTAHFARPKECSERYRETLEKIHEMIRHIGSRDGASGRINGGDGDDPHDPVGLSSLTSREIEILSLVAEGLPNGSIARRLCISSFTVRNHVQRILGKLGLHSKSQAVCFAFRRRLLQ